MDMEGGGFFGGDGGRNHPNIHADVEIFEFIRRSTLGVAFGEKPNSPPF